MLYREITAVCSEILTKHINTLCGQNVGFVNVKPGGTYSSHKAVEAPRIPLPNPSNHSGTYTHRLTISTRLSICATQFTHTKNSDYFPLQHKAFVFKTRTHTALWQAECKFSHLYDIHEHRPSHSCGGLVAGLSPCRPGFDPRSVQVRFLVDREARWQVSLPVLRLSPVRIIPPMFYTHFYTNTTFIRRTSGRNLETFKQSSVLISGEHCTKDYFKVICMNFRLQRVQNFSN
jgi:hypothetical protein